MTDFPQAPLSPNRDWRRSVLRPSMVLIGSLLLGLGIRVWFVFQPPAPSTKWDHHEYVRWGILMREEGFAALYDHPPRETLMWDHQDGRAKTARHPEQFICNYPPLAAHLLYGQITALGWFDNSLVSNTRAARVIYASLSILGDVLIAAGCFALVRRLISINPAARLVPAVAFAAVMLAPPFFLDSARWTQTDSWVLAPAVWMLWAMLPRQGAPSLGDGGLTCRWILAGALWGIALGLKTQAVLFAPVWVFALLVSRQRKPIILALALSAAALFIPSLPFVFRSGLKWFEESYVNNLLWSYKETTLRAFNLWYLDLLICEDTNAGRRLLGVEKDAWGKILLGAAVVGSGMLLARQRRSRAEYLVAFTALTLLAAVILPTRVHERYILLPIPFLIALAALRPRMWLALAPFIVVASFQMTVLDWLGLGADSWSRVAERVHNQYEEYRITLPPEQFAALPPPEEKLAGERPRFEADRAEQGRKKWEWILTLVELTSAAALGVLILRGRAEPNASLDDLADDLAQPRFSGPRSSASRG